MSVVGAEVLSRVPDEVCEDRMALMKRKVTAVEAALQEAVSLSANDGRGGGGERAQAEPGAVSILTMELPGGQRHTVLEGSELYGVSDVFEQ